MLADVCRRGYDVLLLAQHGADPAIGLEISSDAVRLTLFNVNSDKNLVADIIVHSQL